VLLQRVFSALALALVAIATAFAAFDRGAPSDSLPDISGEWKSWRSTFRIAREPGGYRIEVTNPDGFLGGVYIGKPKGDVVVVSGPMSALCGEVRYAKDDDALEFCGEAFLRGPQT
jgi:hypothetical protein